MALHYCEVIGVKANVYDSLQGIVVLVALHDVSIGIGRSGEAVVPERLRGPVEYVHGCSVRRQFRYSGVAQFVTLDIQRDVEVLSGFGSQV